jgi:peptidoglycan hydrolase CwlO-like protein
MKEGKITHWLLTGKLVSKSMGTLFLASAVYIVVVTLSFTKDFIVSSLTFKGIFAYSMSVFSFDNTPIKNDSEGQSAATFVRNSMPSNGSFCISSASKASKAFKSSTITFKNPKLKTINPLAPELSQHPLAFFSGSDQQIFPDVLQGRDSTPVIQKSVPQTSPQPVQGNTFSYPQQLQDAQVQLQNTAVVQGSGQPMPILLVAPPQPIPIIQGPVQQPVAIQTTPVLTPFSQPSVVLANPQQVLSVVSTVPVPPALPAMPVRSSSSKMSHAGMLQRRMTQVQRDLEQKLEQEREKEKKQRQLEEASRLTAEAKRQEIEQRKNAGQIKTQLRAAAKLAAVEILEISEIFVPELPALPLRAVNFVLEPLQTLLAAKKNELDQKRAAILEAKRLRETKSSTEEVIKEASIKVFRVPGNSIAAEYLREGINPETFQPLMGNETIEYIDDMEVSGAFFSLLPEEGDQPSSLQENFDTSLIKKLISFYKYFLRAYNVWEALENSKLHDITKSVRNEGIELEKINSQLEEFKAKAEAEEKILKYNIGRIFSAINSNKMKRCEKLEEIKSTVIEMAKPYKEWIELLNKQIEKISKEKGALEQQLENNDNSVWDLRSLKDEKKKLVDNLERGIKKRRVTLEMERDKAEKTYNESHSNMQNLVEYCIEEGLKNNGITVSNEEIKENYIKLAIIFKNGSDDEVNQILVNIEESMSEESWENVNKELISQIDVFREASRVLEGVNSSIEKDAELQELQRKLGVAKTQLEEIDKEIGEIRGKIDELDNELITVNETLENVKMNHDAFENWAKSLEDMDEKSILDSLEVAKEGLSRMKEHLQSCGREITRFEEDYEALQKLGKSLEEQLTVDQELDQQHVKHKDELAVLKETYSAVFTKYNNKRRKHLSHKKKFAAAKRDKELMLKEALGIAEELSKDILQLKNYVVTPTRAKEYAEFTQRFLCKLTLQGPLAVLASAWQEFEIPLEGEIRQEPTVLDFEKTLSQKANRMPLRNGSSREELTESF